MFIQNPVAALRASGVNIWDALVIAIFVSTSFFIRELTGLLLVLAVVPVLWGIVRLKLPRVTKLDLLCVFLLFQHLAYFTLNLTIFPPQFGFEPSMTASKYSYWLGFVPIILLIVMRMKMVVNLKSLLRYVVPPVLTLSFVLLTVDNFTPWITNGCRIVGFYPKGLPFTPTLFFTGFTFLSFFGWRGFTPVEKAWRLVFIPMSFLIALPYTGSRSLFLIQGLLFGLLFLGLLIWVSKKKLRDLVLYPVFILMSVGFAFSVCYLTPCGKFLADRQLSVFTNAFSDDYSLSRRTEILGEAIQTITGAPSVPTKERKRASEDKPSLTTALLVGRGVWFEEFSLIGPDGNKHVHNQYLSWVIGGGLLGMLSGILFVGAAVPAIFKQKDPFDRFTLFLASCGLMLFAIFFDVFMHLFTYVEWHIIMFSICITLASQTEQKPS